ncbi:MAG: DUF599 domain-containing protein [Rhodothermales bacterium]
MFDHQQDLICVSASVVLLLGYFFFTLLRGRRRPGATMQNANQAVRAMWVKHILEDPPNRSLLAIQTLRNSTMAATFFATTAVLLMIGTLNLSGQADKFMPALEQIGILSPSHSGLWLFKVLLLTGDLFVAFFAFAMAVRLFNHVGYQVIVPQAVRDPLIDETAIIGYMQRAGGYYSFGMRAYFIAVPLTFWLFGPVLLLAATVVVVVVLSVMDRVPHE